MQFTPTISNNPWYSYQGCELSFLDFWNLSVNMFNNAFFYTEGKSVRLARESPDFIASKLSSLPPPEHIIDSIWSLLKLTIFDFNEPRWSSSLTLFFGSSLFVLLFLIYIGPYSFIFKIKYLFNRKKILIKSVLSF